MSIMGSMRLLNAIENETIGGIDLDTYLADPRQFNEFQALLNTRVYRDRLFSTNAFDNLIGSSLAMDAILSSRNAVTSIIQSANLASRLVGTPAGGGYFMGFYMHSPTERRALIDAGKDGEFEGLMWKTAQTDTPNTNSDIDGAANTDAMTTAALKSQHPAAAACSDYNGGGKTDWSLPAKNQLEIIYRQAKPFTQENHATSGANPDSLPPTGNYTAKNPAQTGIVSYQKGGINAYDDTKTYWTSTQYNATSARLQSFSNGNQYTSSKSNTFYWCRAVRSFVV